MKISIWKGAAALTAAGILFASSAGITGAFLTHRTEELMNGITGGSVEVKVTENSWVEEEARGLTPGKAVSKDPRVINTGRSHAWVFLKVTVPFKHISVVNQETKRKEAAAEVPLFTFTTLEGWELVDEEKKAGETTFVYGFSSVVRPGESTKPLFEQVKLPDFLEGELKGEEKLTLPLEAMSIQTNVCREGASLEEIYRQYLLQEEADEKEETKSEDKIAET